MSTDDFDAVPDLMGLFDTLRNDTYRCLESAQSIGDPAGVAEPTREQVELLGFWIRMFVRAFGAQVEGTNTVFKRMAFIFGSAGPFQYTFTQADLAGINEVAYAIQNGTAVETKLKINTLENMRFAFQILANVFRVDFRLQTGGQGWVAYRAFNTLRDRMTHPKQAEDVWPPLAAFQTLTQAYGWYTEESTRLMRLTREAMRATGLMP